MISARVNEDRHRKNMAAGPIPPWLPPIPPSRHASFHRRKDDGGGINASRHRSRKTHAADPLPPSAATHRSISEKTMGVGLTPLDIDREKLTLQILYPPNPPDRRGTGLRQKDDGVVGDDLDLKRSVEEISLLTPNPPPRAGEDRSI